MDYNELIETYLEQEIDILKRIDVSAVNEMGEVLQRRLIFKMILIREFPSI